MATVTEGEQTEKISLSSYAKKHVRYGSMAKESGMKSEKYIKHLVQPSDTLQGLALRYGVTVSLNIYLLTYLFQLPFNLDTLICCNSYVLIYYFRS